MSVNEIVELAKRAVKEGGFWMVVILTIVQVTPIKVNPWSWLWGKAKNVLTRAFAYIGKCANGELLEKVQEMDTGMSSMKASVSSLSDKVEAMAADAKEQAAINSRARILRFGDEVLHEQRHSKDHFDSVLRDAKAYENYCKEHPEFENGVTEPTISRIKAVYADRLSKNDFL